MKLDWLKEVDWKECLTEDLRMVLASCGEDVVLSLLEHLLGQRIHVSTTTIRNAQRAYVRKFAKQKSPREISVAIGASIRFVQLEIAELENEDQQD